MPGAIPTIYSLYWPETARITEGLWDSHPHDWYDRAWERQNEHPDLVMLDTWHEWSGLNLTGFNHTYCSNGASEAIKDLTVPINKLCHIAVFDGEYEGYRAFARARNMHVFQVARGTRPRDMYFGSNPETAFWISDPSAIDGEHWLDLPQFLEDMHRAHPTVRVFLDAIYTGVAKDLAPINPSEHPNVEAVVFSLSKPFGVYRHRVGGVFSRSPIPSLEGNKWFNNAFSLELATALMRKYGPTELPQKYAPIQAEAVSQLIVRGVLPAGTVPSNCVLLARSNEGPDMFKRTDGKYRYCLTPAMHTLIGER